MDNQNLQLSLRLDPWITSFRAAIKNLDVPEDGKNASVNPRTPNDLQNQAENEFGQNRLFHQIIASDQHPVSKTYSRGSNGYLE